MSVMCCIYVPEGIVLAADSRLTRTKPLFTQPNLIQVPGMGQIPVVAKEITYTLSDNAQKVLLIKKNNVGVSFCGNALINGITVADYIRKFEIDKVLTTDTTEDTAKKLADCGLDKSTQFIVCGFDEDIPYVYYVNGSEVKRLNVEVVQSEVQNIEVKASADNVENPELGSPEIVISEEVIEKLKEENKNIPTVTYGANWGGQQIAITKLMNVQPTLAANFVTMPLKDAIDFSEFLIDLTIKYERFCDNIQTCGGEIDILVITKDDAFWKQHKVYNPIK